MKAIIYSAPTEFAFTDVPDPVLKPDEVLIRVRACGFCRTDMHIHQGQFISEFPLINGHEISGEIAGVGDKVRDFRVGDRVVADNTELCGYCRYCRADQPLYCENFVSHGCNVAGGFAEYVAIKAEKVFRVHNLSFEEAVMVEPTACAMHGMDVMAIKPGSEVLLFGAGPTGLILAQLLKQNGAVQLVVAAPPGKKLDLALELGADEVIAIDKRDASKHAAAIRALKPDGFDVVIEATGVAALFGESIGYARIGGQVVAYGLYDEDAFVQVKPYDIFRRELTVKGSFAQTHKFERALRYLESGQVRVKEMLTHILPLSEYGTALDLMRDGTAIKLALTPDSV